jgi:hypothetical protein
MSVSTVKIPAVLSVFHHRYATAEIDLHPEGIDNLQMGPCHRVHRGATDLCFYRSTAARRLQ